MGETYADISPFILFPVLGDKRCTFQLIRRGTDAGGSSRFRRLELTDMAVREKVLRAVSDDELATIFVSDGLCD